jgi:hypothetical protein
MLLAAEVATAPCLTRDVGDMNQRPVVFPIVALVSCVGEIQLGAA